MFRISLFLFSTNPARQMYDPLMDRILGLNFLFSLIDEQKQPTILHDLFCVHVPDTLKYFAYTKIFLRELRRVLREWACCMGVKCSSEVFQRSMEQNFGDIDGAEIIVDDILIHEELSKNTISAWRPCSRRHDQ